MAQGELYVIMHEYTTVIFDKIRVIQSFPDSIQIQRWPISKKMEFIRLSSSF